MIRHITHIVPRLRRFLKFGIVGGLGAVLNTVILFILTEYLSVFYLLASAIATEIAIISNFIGNHLFTFRDITNTLPLWKKFLSFQLVSLASLVVTVTTLWIFVSLFGKELLLVWNLCAITVAFVFNFVLNSRITWKHTDTVKDTKTTQ